MSKYYIRNYGILVLLVFFLTKTSSINASDVNIPSSNPDECLNCHSEFDHPDSKNFDAEKCAKCHQPKVMHESSLKKLKPKKDGYVMDESADLHMEVPLYYPVSRLGGDPNPMVKVPGGIFIMGTNSRLADEGPEHTVTISEFMIDVYEVTNHQYMKFINATNRRSPKHFRNRTYPNGKADHPVTFVSWYDANDYCKWAGKRLPTDDEWEKAARGPDGQIFPWGNEFETRRANTPQRWKELKLEGDTSPVGAFKLGASYYGAHDMSGNVWEWTSSWYKRYPGNKDLTNENYGEKYKTLKGGSYWDCSFYQCGMSAPVYNRSFFIRTSKNNSFGFRCAADAKNN